MSGGAGSMVDVSASVSEASTQGFDNQTGAFSVGGASGSTWLVWALVALAAFALFLWFKRRK